MSQSDLKSQVTSGILWSGIGRVVQQVVQFGLSVVMARLLSPGDYGLMAMVMVFTGFAGMLADAGFNTALVQKQDLSDLHIHTIYWVTLASGVFLAGTTFLISPLLADFYHAPILTQIFRIISINFVVGAVGNVPSALLQKRMQFKTLAKIDTTSLLLSGIVGIGAAWYGVGVWSLVAQSVSAAMMTAVFRCLSCKWIPKPVFSGAALKEMWGFSGNLYGFNFINYWARNADNLMVGKFFGAASLGAYNRAYALMLLPITQINSVISQVVFPAFASIQDDKERVKRIYLQAIGIVALLAFPMMFGLLVVAQPFVLTLYGNKWSAVIPVFQILALVGIMQVIGNSTGWLFLSQGRTDVMLFWGTICAVAVIISLVIGVLIGSVVAVAVCYAIVNMLYFYPILSVAGKIVNMKASEILLAVAGPFISSVIMAIVIGTTSYFLPAELVAWQQLSILVSGGIVVYGAVVYSAKLSSWKDLLRIINERRNKAQHILVN